MSVFPTEPGGRICPAHLVGDQNSLVFRPFKPECFLNMSLLTPANRPLSLLVESFAEVLRAEIKALVERAAGLRDLP